MFPKAVLRGMSKEANVSKLLEGLKSCSRKKRIFIEICKEKKILSMVRVSLNWAEISTLGAVPVFFVGSEPLNIPTYYLGQ